MVEPIDLTGVVAEVRAAFDAYETALKRNDVATLNDFFWEDPRAIRYGIAEHNHGIAEIRRWRAASPPIAGTRHLEGTHIVTFGRDAASVVTRFREDGSPTIGRQTQMWVRFPTGWKIVAAHVSLLAPAAGV